MNEQNEFELDTEDIEASPDWDFNDLSDVPDYEQYIRPLLDCGYPWWEKQHELSRLIHNMWIKMREDGRSPYYIAKVSVIAEERMWAYKKQMGGADII